MTVIYVGGTLSAFAFGLSIAEMLAKEKFKSLRLILTYTAMLTSILLLIFEAFRN